MKCNFLMISTALALISTSAFAAQVSNKEYAAAAAPATATPAAPASGAAGAVMDTLGNAASAVTNTVKAIDDAWFGSNIGDAYDKINTQMKELKAKFKDMPGGDTQIKELDQLQEDMNKKIEGYKKVAANCSVSENKSSTTPDPKMAEALAKEKEKLKTLQADLQSSLKLMTERVQALTSATPATPAKK